ncbi:MAG: autotransporter domain-containing protein [Candidatus Thiodiazotropha sp.]
MRARIRLGWSVASVLYWRRKILQWGPFRDRFTRLHLPFTLVLVALALSIPNSLQANDIQLTGLSQSPPNSVAVGLPITYTLTTNNVDDGINPPSTIGISIRMRVDGTVIRADSGDIDAVGCSVDASFPDYFACNNLLEGGSQTPSFTWNNPTPGNHTVVFEAACQWIPVQVPPAFCTSFGTTIATTTMVGAFPTATISPAGPLILDELIAFPLNFDGLMSTDPDGTIAQCEFSLNGAPYTTEPTCAVEYTTLTPGDYFLDLRVTDNHGLTDIDTVGFRILSFPEAVGGPDQTVTDTDNDGSENITLDASGSSDVGGTIVSFEWFEFDVNPGTPIATGVSASLPMTVGTHFITLRVTDNDGMVSEDPLTITVLPGPNAPIANAGPDQQVTDSDSNNTEDVTLDGSGSSDSDGTIVSYEWLLQGTQVATGVAPTVALSVGTHTLTLRVTDNDTLFSEDQVVITVTAGPSAPIADAGQDITLTDTDASGDELVSLDASGSSDADGTIVSYVWLDNGVEIASGATATITLPVGVHTLTLRVTDNSDLFTEDQLTVTVNASTGIPTADAGSDQSLTDTDGDGTASISLDATNSIDADGTIVSYQWYEGSNQIATGPTPSVELGIGIHTITLRVTDDSGLSHEDQVTITVLRDESQLQIVSGSNISGSAGETVGPFTVQLVDTDGNPIVDRTISWQLIPESAGSLSESESITDQEGQAATSLTIQQTGVIKLIATLNTETVEFVINSIAETPGLTENQQAIGSSMDNLCPSLVEKQSSGSLTAAEQDLLMTCDNLTTDSATETAKTLSQLVPEEVAAQGNATLEAASSQTGNINSRLVALRAGDTGFNFSGLTVNYAGISFNRGLFAGLLSADESSRGGGAGDEQLQGRWGAFINGTANFGDKDETDREAGFDFDTRGITLGLDYRFNRQLVAGGAIGYSRFDSDYNDAAGNLEMDAWSLSAYGTYYQNNNVYVDGLIKYGSNSYDTRRRVNAVGAPDQFGLGDTDGTEFSLNISAGYDYHRDALTITPYGRLSYTRAEIDAYSETASNPAVAGAGSMLRIDDQDLDSMVLVLGGNLSYAVSTPSAVYIPQLRFEWEHEFEDDARFINARFIHDPTQSRFTVDTDKADSDYFNFGVGISAVFAQGRSGYLFYETRIDQDDVTLHMINGGLRIEF